MYEELTEEDATRLAVKHLNRGQEIPPELMHVLEGLGIAAYFTSEVEEEAA